MPSAPPEIWSRLRASRSAPPGQAASTPERRRTFAAAMEQFEELIHAAQSVGPPARPLPLFYALSQAGRAIAAARGKDDARQLRGHGIQLDDDGSPLLDRHVAPQAERQPKAGKPPQCPSSFMGVSDATGSPRLTDPVTVGALCASLPESAVGPELCG